MMAQVIHKHRLRHINPGYQLVYLFQVAPPPPVPNAKCKTCQVIVEHSPKAVVKL